MSKIKNVLARAISLASEQPMSYNEVKSVQEHERASGSDRHGSKERAGQDPGRGRL